MKLAIWSLALLASVHSAHATCNPGVEQEDMTRIWFSLTHNSSGYSYSTLIGFVPNGLEELDDCDVDYPFLGEPNRFMIFSYANDLPLQIQAVPPLTESRDIILGHQTPEIETHTISIFNADHFDVASSIVLEDTETEMFQDLLSANYSFLPLAYEDLDRFIIHIYLPSEATTTLELVNRNIQMSGFGRAEFSVTDSRGQVVSRGNFMGTSFIPVESWEPGAYFVSVRGDGVRRSMKIVKSQ
jgi:hypothetical protein